MSGSHPVKLAAHQPRPRSLDRRVRRASATRRARGDATPGSRAPRPNAATRTAATRPWNGYRTSKRTTEKKDLWSQGRRRERPELVAVSRRTVEIFFKPPFRHQHTSRPCVESCRGHRVAATGRACSVRAAEFWYSRSQTLDFRGRPMGISSRSPPPSRSSSAAQVHRSRPFRCTISAERRRKRRSNSVRRDQSNSRGRLTVAPSAVNRLQPCANPEENEGGSFARATPREKRREGKRWRPVLAQLAAYRARGGRAISMLTPDRGAEGGWRSRSYATHGASSSPETTDALASCEGLACDESIASPLVRKRRSKKICFE